MIEWVILALIGAAAIYFLFFYQNGALGQKLLGSSSTNSTPNPDGSQSNTGSLTDSYSISQSAMEGGSTPYSTIVNALSGGAISIENAWNNLTGRGPQPISSPSLGSNQSNGPVSTSVIASPPVSVMAISGTPHPNNATLGSSPYVSPIQQLKTQPALTLGVPKSAVSNMVA